VTRIQWFINETSKFPIHDQVIAYCTVAVIILLIARAIHIIAYGAPMSCLDGEIDSPEGMTVVTLPPIAK
jgi:hypothetical protein